MQYQATAKYLRISPRKARKVADLIRPLSIEKALQQLSIMPKAAGVTLKKVIDCAVANARVKNGKGTDTLRFFRIDVSEGPSMKRWHAVSKGSAHSYKKRMTHIKVVLTDDVNDTEKRVIKGGEKHGTKN